MTMSNELTSFTVEGHQQLHHITYFDKILH